MSRIGKQPIELPQGVEVTIQTDKVTIKGPKGELTQDISDDILVAQKENQLIISLKRKTKTSPA
ncbi:MAG: 50S ribosomal protein L6, partial [Parcubacteria group bacterium]|nr:50S ribosomal protein L6 [Parcubacteria group bacterium]